MPNERLDLTDTIMSAIMKLAEDNPGAITAILEMVKVSTVADPDSFFGAFTPLMSLDTQGIYGSRIWILYSDVCDRNAVDALMLLRCVQMGILPERSLNTAIDNRGHGIDMAVLRQDLSKALPNFVMDAGKSAIEVGRTR